MEIFIFQIAVLAIIFLSSFFGREALNKTVLVVSVFTLIAVFMTWLIILQFITIVISYSLAIANINREQEIAERKFTNSQNYSESSSSNNSGCFSPLKLIMIAICIYFAYSVWSSKNNIGNNIETEKVEELKNDNRLNIDTVSIATPNYDEENYEYINDTTESDIHSDESEYKEQIVDEKYDSYNDWGDSEEYIHGGSVKYGNFKLIENRKCSLDNGKLYIKKRGANKIDFAMEVGNRIGYGKLEGIAVLTTDRSRAIFQSYDCESLIFDFLTDGTIRVTEINCENYHDETICFNSVFR